MGCRIERARQWAVRITHEASMHKQNSFLTLTYDDEHLDPNYSLNVKDWQTFAKALRKKDGPFRFYHCGEYGDLNGRPHLHAAIFGLDFHASRIPYKKTKSGHQLYTSQRLEDVWGKGQVIIGNLDFDSANYVAGYILKKITGEKATDWYAGTTPEYATMSRRPGLGKKWIDKYQDEVYPDDYVVINGKKATPPKFYDTQLEVSAPAVFDKIKTERRKKGQLHKADQTPERLETIETCIKSRMSLYAREL